MKRRTLAELMSDCARLHARLDELRGELAEIRASLGALDALTAGRIVHDTSHAECIVYAGAIRVCALGTRGCLARHGGQP
jgi:hypothetical protein